eukprot:TRINITY_DN11774_c0_g1_i2.p1 TRINITY_DN11774_c0_g1~~TRINITY_DN11774_c0_g1_i2.p1  ORF type:complete len:330 (-),score=94.44 TRINITY_DN11774_c0_g1_i2:335-1324(-)
MAWWGNSSSGRSQAPLVVFCLVLGVVLFYFIHFSRVENQKENSLGSTSELLISKLLDEVKELKKLHESNEKQFQALSESQKEVLSQNKLQIEKFSLMTRTLETIKRTQEQEEKERAKERQRDLAAEQPQDQQQQPGKVKNFYADYIKQQGKVFDSIASRFGTDKSSASRLHSYEWAYVLFLSPLRGKRLKMMQIGLGCGTPLGPGSSLSLWKEFLGEQIELHVVEADRNCAAPFVDRVHHLHIGDPSSEEFLNELVKKTGGNFDLVVDDGDHTMKQQLMGLKVLFGALKSGGFYFLEDLYTSYSPYGNFGGKFNSNQTTIGKIKSLIDV